MIHIHEFINLKFNIELGGGVFLYESQNIILKILVTIKHFYNKGFSSFWLKKDVFTYRDV